MPQLNESELQFQPAPIPPIGPSTVPQTVPVPEPMLPDEAVDPFQDDSAGRVRKIPAKTIQFRNDRPNYGSDYDPQASIRVKFSDGQSVAAQLPVSSRKPLALRQAVSKTGDVVPAAAWRLRPITSTAARRLPAQTEPLPNPLRPSQKNESQHR